MLVNPVANQAVYYGYPMWAVYNLEQVQSTDSISKERGLRAVDRVHEVNMIKRTHPHLGRNFDRYA